MSRRPETTAGDRLRRERELRGWSQAHVAELIGAPSREHVSRWERGVVIPGPHYRERYCRLFGRSGDELGFIAPLALSLNALPTVSTTLIGRTEILAEACSLVRDEGVRLLTLTGPPGVGKTRLGLAAASELRPEFPDGVYLVDLASLDDPALVGPAIVRAVGLRAAEPRPVVQTLAAHLADRRALLLLDNFEHLLPAARLLAELLARCPTIHVLLTSRARVRIRDEHEMLVPTLPVPLRSDPSTPRFLSSIPSVALFVDRARAHLPDFRLTQHNARHLAEICGRLDGLPLALELAAAWIRLLEPEHLLARLEQRLPMLQYGPRDLPDRQRTMERTLRWSYDLLSAEEQAMFRRISVFASRLPLDAVESVCCAAGPIQANLLHLLVELSAKSLVRRDVRTGIVMLETVREFAQQCLRECDEFEATSAAHLDYYADVAARAEPELVGPDQAAWLARLESEHANIRAALHWSKASGRTASGLLLASRVSKFWEVHGHLHEGAELLDGLLASVTAVDGELRARALSAAGTLHSRRGDQTTAQDRYRASLELYRETNNQAGVAKVLNNLGYVVQLQGDHVGAAEIFSESLVIKRLLRDEHGMAATLANLATAITAQGRYSDAEAVLREALGIWRGAGDRLGVAIALSNLGDDIRAQGRCDDAVTCLEEAISLCRDLGALASLSLALKNRGDVARDQGDYPTARSAYGESLRLAMQLGAQVTAAYDLEGIASVGAGQGQTVGAARLYGAAHRIRLSWRTPQTALDRMDHGRILRQLETALGQARFLAEWTVGAAMSLDDAVVLAEQAEGGGEPGDVSAAWPS